jgi:hypothetical protein
LVIHVILVKYIGQSLPDQAAENTDNIGDSGEKGARKSLE